MADPRTATVDRIATGVAAAGVVVSLALHVSGWLGTGFGFEVNFVLFVACFIVWGRAVTRMQAVFGPSFGKAGVWQAVSSRAPRWAIRLRQPLIYYAGATWLYVMYLHFMQGQSPNDALWTRFYTAFGLIFFFYGWVALRALRDPAPWEATMAMGGAAEQGVEADEAR